MWSEAAMRNRLLGTLFIFLALTQKITTYEIGILQSLAVQNDPEAINALDHHYLYKVLKQTHRLDYHFPGVVLKNEANSNRVLFRV